MFGPVEMKVEADGHREWKYPVISIITGFDTIPDIPIGAPCSQDVYAYFTGYQTKDGQI